MKIKKRTSKKRKVNSILKKHDFELAKFEIWLMEGYLRTYKKFRRSKPSYIG
jgi:hypothetical protein